MRRLRHFANPVLLFAAHSRRADLIRQVQYLKVENEILRKRLIRHARRVGAAIAHIVSIVKPNTMLAWISGRPAHGRSPHALMPAIGHRCHPQMLCDGLRRSSRASSGFDHVGKRRRCQIGFNDRQGVVKIAMERAQIDVRWVAQRA